MYRNYSKGWLHFEKDSSRERDVLDQSYPALQGICNIGTFVGFVASGMGVYCVREAPETGVQYRSLASRYPPNGRCTAGARVADTVR